jgi:glycosyltransferase involved in cell wall biosynthesis/SAM-dependent methyltransferase
VDKIVAVSVRREIDYDSVKECPPRVTIGLPVHNGAQTIRRTLESILSQSYRAFDLVISENCSTDETPNIIKEYSGKFDRLTVKWLREKKSVIDNFYSLLDYCSSEYFVWIAADDWWEPEFLGQCVERLDSDDNIQLVFTHHRVYYHFLDRYSTRGSYSPSMSGDREFNFLSRIFDMAPCAFYGVYRTPTAKAVARLVPTGFDFSDVVVTAAVALRGKIAIVERDLFRAGIRDKQSIIRRSIDGRKIRYGRFFKEVATLAFRTFRLAKSLTLLPVIAARILAIRQYHLSTGISQPFEPDKLLRREEIDLESERNLTTYLKASVEPRCITQAELHTFNPQTRDAWVATKARTVTKGARVLDVGAGAAPYRALFSHCEYRTHDFAKYSKYRDGTEGRYTDLDYVSDICKIPVPDASFDVILCTEVLEHVPRPIDALIEMVRIVRPGGRLFITAPLGSGLHQQPYHFYGGYTEHWYRKFLSDYGCEVLEITPNHGFFANLAQECCRFSWLIDRHKIFHGSRADELSNFISGVLAPYLFSMDKEILIPEFTLGYHVEARRLEV